MAHINKFAHNIIVDSTFYNTYNLLQDMIKHQEGKKNAKSYQK